MQVIRFLRIGIMKPWSKSLKAAAKIILGMTGKTINIGICAFPARNALRMQPARFIG